MVGTVLGFLLVGGIVAFWISVARKDRQKERREAAQLREARIRHTMREQYGYGTFGEMIAKQKDDEKPT